MNKPLSTLVYATLNIKNINETKNQNNKNSCKLKPILLDKLIARNT